MSRKMFLLLVVACVFSVASCQTHSLVGRKVDYLPPLWCKIGSLPDSCASADGNFRYTYEISKTDHLTNYKIKGTANFVGTGGFTRLHQGSAPAGYQPARFLLALARNGVIIETIDLGIWGEDLTRTMNFEQAFHFNQPFDAVAIGIVAGTFSG